MSDLKEERRMKMNRNRAAFMTAWISTEDRNLLIKTFLSVEGKR